MSTHAALRWFLSLAILFTVGRAEAAAPTAISRIPFTITKPGRYLLSKSLTISTNFNAITIAADNVTLDLGDWTLEAIGLANTTHPSAAIFSLSQKNITIRNGTIRGFFRGIQLDQLDGAAHLVEKVRTVDCKYLGIEVQGKGSTVRRNRVFNTGSATSFLLERIGIAVAGDSINVTDNEVSDVVLNSTHGTDRAFGIRIQNSRSSNVSGNRVLNSLDLFPGLATTTSGIIFQQCGWCIAAGNQVSGYSVGLEFTNSGASAYSGNTVARAFTPYKVTGDGVTVGAGNTP